MFHIRACDFRDLYTYRTRIHVHVFRVAGINHQCGTALASPDHHAARCRRTVFIGQLVVHREVGWSHRSIVKRKGVDILGIVPFRSANTRHRYRKRFLVIRPRHPESLFVVVYLPVHKERERQAVQLVQAIRQIQISPDPEVAASSQDGGTNCGTRSGHELLSLQGPEELLSRKGRILHHERRQGVLAVDLVEVLYGDLPSVFKDKD